jgi:hypothetical protein
MHILRLVLFCLSALAALGLGIALLKPASTPRIAASQSERQVSEDEIREARQSIEAELAGVSEYAGVLERMKQVFPAETETFLTELARNAAASGEMPSADAMIVQAIKALRITHGVLAARAEAPVLDQVFIVQRALLSALAGDNQHLCVDFLYGGANGAFFRFAENHRDLVATFAMANIDAIKDGRERQIERPQPSAQDLQVLEDRLREAGLDTPAIEAILDGRIGEPPLEDARLCEAGQIYLDTLAGLPDDVRLRIYGLAVELMARS